nr:hypothetical protein [uncultured bacterium]
MGQEEFDAVFSIVLRVLAIGVTAVACIPFGVIVYKIFQLMTYRKTKAEILRAWTTQKRVSDGDMHSIYHATYAYTYKGFPYETSIETAIPKQSGSGKIRHSRSNPTKIYKPSGLLVAIFCAGPAALVLFLVVMFSEKLFGS